MSLPRTVRVGPATYRIERETEAGKDGQLLLTEQLLKVRGGMGPDETADTLLHELLHACIYQSGYLAVALDDEEEETLVRTLTPILLDTLRRNPAICKALGIS